MKTKFEIIDLGMMKYFLGIKVNKCVNGIFICQSKYAKDILRRFRMENCKLVVTPIATGTKLSRKIMDQVLYQHRIRD